jgi:hypothetical protein
MAKALISHCTNVPEELIVPQHGTARVRRDCRVGSPFEPFRGPLGGPLKLECSKVGTVNGTRKRPSLNRVDGARVIGAHLGTMVALASGRARAVLS